MKNLKFKRAIKELFNALDMNKNNAKVLNLMFKCNIALGNIHEAKKCFTDEKTPNEQENQVILESASTI